MNRGHRLLLAVFVLIPLLAGLTGCEMEQRVVRGPWWDQLPADGKATPGNAAGSRQAGGAWSIALARFTGPDRQQQARTLIAQVQQASSARDLWTEDVDGVATVYRGRFADPVSEDARMALQHTRRIQLDGVQPFADTRLTNLGAAGDERSTNPYDLRQFPGYYTLQIGFYDAQFGRDFRQAAEQAAEELRQEDHDAYFYHGPNRSLITVGLFTYAEAFVTTDDPAAPRSQVDAYSPRVRQLQESFPFNLGNGLTRIDYDRDGQRIGEQHSFLVRVF